MRNTEVFANTSCNHTHDNDIQAQKKKKPHRSGGVFTDQ